MLGQMNAEIYGKEGFFCILTESRSGVDDEFFNRHIPNLQKKRREPFSPPLIVRCCYRRVS